MLAKAQSSEPLRERLEVLLLETREIVATATIDQLTTAIPAVIEAVSTTLPRIRVPTVAPTPVVVSILRVSIAASAIPAFTGALVDMAGNSVRIARI